MVSSLETESLMRPWLGGELLRGANDLPKSAAALLNRFSLGAGALSKTREAIDSLIFKRLTELTRGRMLAHLDDGRWIRVRLSDCEALADELMYPLFRSFPPDAAHYLLVRDFSMECDSLSALRALIERFPAFQTEEELEAVKRIVKGCHPPFRWREWLK